MLFQIFGWNVVRRIERTNFYISVWVGSLAFDKMFLMIIEIKDMIEH